MSLKTVLELEYETQHFGAHPRTFLDTVYNVFFENLSKGLSELKDFLTQQYSDMMPPDAINFHTDILLQALMKKLDKCMDKLEVFLNLNVFWIPNHIVLPEDAVHVTIACTKEEDLKLNEEIKELERKILEERSRSIALKKKLLEQKHLRSVLFDLQRKLKCLLSIASAEGITEENVNLIQSKVLELCIAMKEHPLIPDLS